MYKHYNLKFSLCLNVSQFITSTTMSQLKSLTSDLQKIAEIELNEVPSRIPQDIKALKTWIQQQPHLTARTDDQYLLQFLRGCKYSLEKAKQKIDCFYTLKTKFPELFNVNDVTSERFRKIYRLMFMVVLPTPLNNNGPRIINIRIHDDMLNDIYSVEEICSVTNCIHELLLLDDPYSCINGILYIYDMKNVTGNFLLKYTPSFIKKVIMFYEKSLPLRYKGIYYINTPTIFQSIYNMLYPIASKKLQERITLVGNDMKELHKYIPKMYLPIEYGGENGSLDQVGWDFDKKWDEHRDYFKENVNYGTNEKLRLGKPFDLGETFGVGGSFRKLDVD